MCKWYNEKTGKNICSQNMALYNTWSFLKYKFMEEVVSAMDTKAEYVSNGFYRQVFIETRCW